MAARLAGLLRNRGAGAELVPVRDQGGSGGRPQPEPEPAADVQRPGLPAADPGDVPGPGSPTAVALRADADLGTDPGVSAESA